jgi:hypothetical protein
MQQSILITPSLSMQGAVVNENVFAMCSVVYTSVLEAQTYLS